MPVFIAGTYNLVVFGEATIVGDIGEVERLQMPVTPEAEDTTLHTVTGHYAKVLPEVIQLTATHEVESITGGFRVTLTTQNNPGAIFYTLDGTDVDRTKVAYITPINITGTPGQIKTLKYKAFALAHSGYTDSNQTTLVLTIP